ncbi:MAG: ABC transporter ATP-binding protein, partial [Rhodospirillaceae bacterium]|nr:ABC transporter ATP-binding protein [Rhodospirillaceae bacterium]
VAIARALILQPKLVVLDEPVSALDVSIRAQILNLLRDLQNRFQLTYMFISHDLSVVKHFCDRTCVLYHGKIVEIADSELLYREPLHPYTQALIEAIPASDLDTPSVTERAGLEGDIPSPVNPPSGCRFHTRCPKRMAKCSEQTPELREVKPGHRVACFLTE